jgi:hypothetical protein
MWATVRVISPAAAAAAAGSGIGRAEGSTRAGGGSTIVPRGGELDVDPAVEVGARPDVEALEAGGILRVSCEPWP